MRSKICLLSLVLAVLCSLHACKPKESAYASVYAAAKPKSMVDNEKSKEVAPGESYWPSVSVADSNPFQRERINAVDGTIKLYSVIIGSFVNKTNAESLKDRMILKGYNAFLAKNEKGMYRVVAATFDTRTDAITACEKIKEKYASDFSDAWLLEKIN
jgi:cell division protein FtsN